MQFSRYERWGLVDPFAVKVWPHWHPLRILFVAYSRLRDTLSRRYFSQSALPLLSRASEQSPTYPNEDTSVSPEQMAELLFAVAQCAEIEGAIVEVGSYRGVTTMRLVAATDKLVISVDPFQGWGGSEEDFRLFQTRTVDLPNFRHVRLTSGKAAKVIKEPVSCVFIDAVHDYVNTSFDGAVWGGLVTSGGMLAFHDTDDTAFPGTRRAVWEISQSGKYDFFSHVPGLTIFRKKQLV